VQFILTDSISIDNYVNVCDISEIDSILQSSEGIEAPRVARPITELDR